MENFIYTFHIDPSICDQLIQYHNEMKEYKYPGSSGYDGSIDLNIKESIDVNFYNHSTDKRIKSYFVELQKGYEQYVKKYHLESLPLQTADCNMIQYYPPGGGFKVWHFERDKGDIDRQLVYMTYLNDVPDGGTEWLYQNFQTDAVKGLSVIWPSDFTHTHKGRINHDYEKWIATGWFVYSKMFF